jgi:hypothetical protein
MNAPFSKEVYIRLAEDESAFLCTTTYGKFYSKTTEVALDCQLLREPVDENVLLPLRRRSLHWASEE